MRWLLELQLVWRGLLARKGRTALTMLGIVIGVAGVVVIIALGAGAQSLVLGQVNKLGSNLIGILPGKSNENGPPASVFGVNITTLVPADVVEMRDKTRFPQIVSATGFVRGSATVAWNGRSVDTNLTGAESYYPQVQNVPIESGRFFDEREDRGGAQVMVLGSSVAELLFNGADPIGEIVKIKSVPFRIIGVMEKQGTVAFQNQDDQVIVPLIIAQQQILGIKHLQFARAKISSSVYVASTMAEVSSMLRERHGIKAGEDDDFSVRDLADAIKLLSTITDGLRLFLVLMAAISLIVGGIGIMNIMLVTVAERTREIGLRKAVGATKAAVRNQFLLESAVLTGLGGMIGIIVGAGIAYLVALGARYAGYDWAYEVSLVSVVLSFGVSTLTGVVFGLYPAVKAAKLDPIAALRYE